MTGPLKRISPGWSGPNSDNGMRCRTFYYEPYLTVSFFIDQLAFHISDKHTCGSRGTHTELLIHAASCSFSQTIAIIKEIRMSHCFCPDKSRAYPCLTGAFTRKCKASICSLPRGAAPLLMILSEDKSYFKTTSFFASWTADLNNELQDHLA